MLDALNLPKVYSKLNGKPGHHAEDLSDHKHAQVGSSSVKAIRLAICPLWQNIPDSSRLKGMRIYRNSSCGRRIGYCGLTSVVMFLVLRLLLSSRYMTSTI